MTEPICFGCKHFKQYQPLHFMTPGECKWEPREAVPDWLQSWLDLAERYYGPKRGVSTNFAVRYECAAFEEKTDDPK